MNLPPLFMQQALHAAMRHTIKTGHDIHGTKLDADNLGGEYSLWCHECKTLIASIAIAWDSQKNDIAITVLA